MKLGKSIEYNKKYFFSKNYAENEAGRLVPDLFLFFRKGSGTSFSTTFCVCYFKINIFHVLLTDQIS